MSNASDCYQWWRKLFIEVGGPSAWCEGNHFKVGVSGPGNEHFLAELSQVLPFYTFACQKWMGVWLLGQWLLPSCKISSRSPQFAKRVVTNRSDVLRLNFFLHSQRPHEFFLTGVSQCIQLARVADLSTSFSLHVWVTMGRKSSVRSGCCTLLRRALWIWCLGKFWSCDGLPNLMLKWIWCGSEGCFDDFYLKTVMMIYTLESKVQLLDNFMLCCQRTFCLVFALSFTSCYKSNVYYCSLEHRRSQGWPKGFMAPQMKQIWRQFMNRSLNSWGKGGHAPGSLQWSCFRRFP